MTVLLKADHVTKKFGGLTAVNRVDFEIEVGMIAGLIGPNGAGKTTFFNNITGLYTPTEGTIYFDGEPITGLKPHVIQKRGISRTFQNIRLFGQLSALENVLVGEHVRLHGSILEAFFRPKRVMKEEADAKEKALKILDFVGLGRKIAEQAARNLPYGSQRRLEIARALAVEPRVLMLDEPNAGMNPSETDALLQLIRRIRSDLGLTIVLIAHDIPLVMNLADRIQVLNFGSLIAEGDPATVRANPEVVAAYIGTAKHA